MKTETEFETVTPEVKTYVKTIPISHILVGKTESDVINEIYDDLDDGDLTIITKVQQNVTNKDYIFTITYIKGVQNG